MGASPVVPLDPEKVVYIAYNTGNPTQATVACILKQLLRKQSWNVRVLSSPPTRFGRPDQNFLDLTDKEPQKGVGIVLVSQGLPTDAVGLSALVALKRAGLGLVAVLSNETFMKPSKEILDGLKAKTLLTDAQKKLIERHVPRATGQELVEALMPLSKLIAWSFNPEHNQNLLNTEFQEVEERAKRELEQCSSRLEKGIVVGHPSTESDVGTVCRVKGVTTI